MTSQATEENGVQTAWARARKLSDDGHHAEALEVIRAALRVHPDNTDLLWLEAGVTGSSGKNKESVVMYEKLLQAHPELSPEMRLDLGTQRTIPYKVTCEIDAAVTE